MRIVAAGAATMAGLLALPLLAVATAIGLPHGAPAVGDPIGDTRGTWAQAFATGLGAPTPDAVRFALAWATEEGATAESNNPLDSTLVEPGSSLLPGNPDGVRMYPDLATGLTAGIATLVAADAAFGYQPIIDALRRADIPSAAAALQRSRWCVDPHGPLGHECPGYGAAIGQLAESYADPTTFALAGQVRAGTTSLAPPSGGTTGLAAGTAPSASAGSAPSGAAGTAPSASAGSAPSGAAGTAPSGAAGPAPSGAAGTAPSGRATAATGGTPALAGPGAGMPTLLAWLTRQLGKPYVWGGTGPSGFDCSGLAMMAYAQLGVPLPRTAAQQYAATARVAVPRAEAQPGDLFFWAYRPADPTTIHHVAIYVGAGRIVEAAHEGVPVHEVPVWNDGGLLAVVTRPTRS